MVDVERIAPDTIRFVRLLDAPVDTVWRYLSDPELRAEWFAGGPIEPQVGGKAELRFDHDNLSAEDVPYPEAYAPYKGAISVETVVAYDPPHLLAFSWNGGKDGVARFELSAEGERTRLVLTHSGIVAPNGAANYGAGWHSHLAVLQAKLVGRSIPNFWALHAESEKAIAAQLG
jgi:uncharacterized protein YndB with AHSA1/START domain